MKFLMKLDDHIFEYLKLFVPFKDDFVKTQTSVFQIVTLFNTFNYAADIF